MHGGEVVAAGRALVDHRHRLALLRGVPHEAQPGHHRQGGAGDQEGRGRVDQVEAVGHARLGHVLAEEHHVRLERARAAHLAGHRAERRLPLAGQLRVAVGVHPGGERAELGVGLVETFVQLPARDGVLTGQTDHPVQAAVQFDRLGRARRGVQSVHVLGDDGVHETGRDETGHRPVPRVRPGQPDRLPAEVAACPVAAAVLLAAGEVLVGHRRVPTSAARGAAVVGDAGLGGEPGPAQHEDVPAGEHPLHHRESLGVPGAERGIRGDGCVHARQGTSPDGKDAGR